MLEIPYKKVGSAQEACRAVMSSLSPEKLQKFNLDIEINEVSPGREIVAKGKGFSCTLKFLEDRAVGELNLGFLLKAFQNKILEVLEKELGRAL